MSKKIAILFDKNKKANLEILKEAISVLTDCRAEILLLDENISFFKKTQNKSISFFKNIEDLISSCDISVVLGGDGSIIHFAKLCAKFGKQVLGINTGKMGFLASISKNDIGKLQCVTDGNYIVESHFLIETEYQGKMFLALNEFSLQRTLDSRMPTFEIYKSDEKILEFRSDGVIIATPTGSTAYSLSSGGPIVDNHTDCLLITPICPHNLPYKCVVLPSNQEITVKSHGKMALSSDGKGIYIDLNGEELKIKKSDIEVKFIRFSKNCFYDNVHSKLQKNI